MKPVCLVLLAVSLAGSVSAATHNDVEYATVDGESLKLDAYVPEGPGPFPAVILVHGGGWTSGDKSGGPKKALIAPMQEPLERAGFAWFSINYRLAPKHHFPACLQDLETAIRWVKTHASEYHLDPQKIAISGESAGGHLVALAAVRMNESTRLAAVVPFYGVFDLTALAPAGEPLRGNFAALFGRETVDEATRALLREASPLLQVKAGLPPFLLVHGTADTPRAVRSVSSDANPAEGSRRALRTDRHQGRRSRHGKLELGRAGLQGARGRLAAADVERSRDHDRGALTGRRHHSSTTQRGDVHAAYSSFPGRRGARSESNHRPGLTRVVAHEHRKLVSH